MPTRDEVYAAIRNADKAGDSAGVRKLGAYLQTLPAGAEAPGTPAPGVDHASRVAQIQQDLTQLEGEKPGTLDNIWGTVKNAAKSTADTALNLGSQTVATPIAGIAGLASAPLGFIPGMEGVGARNVERVQNALTIQPQSDVGKETQALIATPFEKLAQGADWAGQKTADIAGPAAGAAINTAVQALPALLMRKGGPISKVRIGGAAAEADAVGAAAGGAAGTTINNITNIDRARTYVTNNLGLDWNALSKSVQERIATIAKDATALDNLDPAAVAREARLQSLPVPVPATRGQLASDRVAIRNEGNVAATKAGQPIADIHLRANQALLDNLDFLKGKVSGSGKTAAVATTPEEAGAVVQGAARGKLELQKAKVKALYEKADQAGETLQPINDGGMLGIMEAVGDTVDQPHFSYANSWLKGNQKKIDAGQITIRDAEKLRKQAVAKAMNGGEDAHYAGQLITAIDAATDGVGGKLYQEARASRRAQALEFQDQGAVADLVDNASRTDRTTALSNTVKAVTGSAPEEIRQIKRTLLTGGDETTRTAGRQAWREVRAQVIQQIRDDATRGVGIVEGGAPNLTPSALNTALRKFGPQKLDEIFGGGTARQLNAILDAAKTVKSVPSTGGGSIGSSTVQNALAFLEKGLIAGTAKIPVVGKIAGGAMQVASEAGGAARVTKTAATTPLSEALSKAKRKSTVGSARQLDPTLVPLSQIGAQQR